MKSTDEREYRSLQVTELRAKTGDDGKPRLEGYAALFNERSQDLGGFVEQIAPGAFADTIKDDDVRGLFNHDENFVLGRTVAKTLTLREDERGLFMEIVPPDTQLVRDLVLEPIRRGDISQMSFAFRVRPNGDQWAEDDDGAIIRTLTRVKLYDVSPVTYPAYLRTEVALRSLAKVVEARSLVLKNAAAAQLDRLRRSLELTAVS
jgi:uncharacterized protein